MLYILYYIYINIYIFTALQVIFALWEIFRTSQELFEISFGMRWLFEERRRCSFFAGRVWKAPDDSVIEEKLQA